MFFRVVFSGQCTCILHDFGYLVHTVCKAFLLRADFLKSQGVVTPVAGLFLMLLSLVLLFLFSMSLMLLMPASGIVVRM